jgi:hypothetical protein
MSSLLKSAVKIRLYLQEQGYQWLRSDGKAVFSYGKGLETATTGANKEVCSRGTSIRQNVSDDSSGTLTEVSAQADNEAHSES